MIRRGDEERQRGSQRGDNGGGGEGLIVRRKGKGEHLQRREGEEKLTN